MRDVFFKVRVNGEIKTFKSYAVAESYGKIIGVTLVPVDERSEEQKEKYKKHAEKIYQIYGIKTK